MDVLKRCVDLILLPFVYPAAWLMKFVRRAGVHNLRLCRAALLQVGVFPIRSHYYEPQFDHGPIDHSRSLPGIDWKVREQLALLDRLVYASELDDLPMQPTGSTSFYLRNSTFGPCDAEYWYQLLRAIKPRRIIEVGSGYSTLMARRALDKNLADDPSYRCEHTCIQPFEMPWLEQVNVRVVRQKVEDVDVAIFSQLQENDILFIDSSHIIRPHGDVLFEYLEVLPRLAQGVIVHIHDFFSPRNYPDRWLREEVRFWNEQYLVEAFLSHNKDWRILGALNYLVVHHYDRLKAVTPYLENAAGSLYIQRC